MDLQQPSAEDGAWIDRDKQAGQYHDRSFLAGHLTTIDVNLPDGNGTHGFVQNNGTFLVVDAPGTPPAVGIAVEGINDQGQLTIHGASSFVGSLP